MTETRATAAAFPPGRYGRRRSGRRRVVPAAMLAVLTVAVLGLLAVRLYRQYGDPTYTAQVIRYTGITDSRVVVDFTVQVPPGGATTCALRARSYDGAEVGRRLVTVAAPPGQRQVAASETVPTRARPFIGEVVRCRAPDPERPG